MRFTKLTLNQWRQYENIDLDIHPRLTIITGANGAGKTTILRIFAQHFGWSFNLLATPKRVKSNGTLSYLTGFFRKRADASQQNIAGAITYDTGTVAQIIVPETGGISFHVAMHNQQPVSGLHINSHRAVQNYKQISSIPTQAISAQHAYQTYHSENVQRFMGGYAEHSPMYRMKEAIISMAMFGPGNANVQGNAELAALYSEFKIVLAKVLPPSIGFKDISVRVPDVVLVTDSGEFVMDAASGGLMSIIDLAWQLFLFSQGKTEYTVTIDEPENHLHPSMQRSLMRRLIDAFPQAQFIVVTHSPFIVSSVKDSYVYVLGYRDSSPQETDDFSNRKVSSLRLDLDSKAATANEILRDVLGVPVTLPEWAENDLRAIASGFRGKEITSDSLDELRRNLNNAGLSEYFPDALKLVVGERL